LPKRIVTVVLALVLIAALWWVIHRILHRDEARVTRTVLATASAINDRDLDAFARFLSQDYRDEYGHSSPGELIGTLRTLLQEIEPGSIRARSITVEVTGDDATATFMASAQPTPNSDPALRLYGGRAHSMRVRLLLRREPDGWHIARAEDVASTMY